ncbi:hypothetical protein C8F04DRAFT_1183632 [Mycena alexandri]|uniref:Uncharacterized protein n=1 Tax=Mycena alexandri TaxID=1745969 RepID=A0AAD6X2D9_9AGAR|nr:hypothetical protein C8F04DRAFT_1183632 [Mycena alexandri]
MALNLLRNRDFGTSLGPFDGRVAALTKLNGENYFITTNAEYVPATPSLKLPHALFLRADMRYGSDDPVLWPQQFTEEFCHMAAIAKRGARPELEVMWWDPQRADFIVKGSVTRNLGRLHPRTISRLLSAINGLFPRYRDLQPTTSRSVADMIGALIETILNWVEQLQSISTTFSRTVFAVTSLQRAFLELDALYEYTTVYKPRMENRFAAASPVPHAVAQCVGAFTTNPTVVLHLSAAGLPVWFLRPTFAFDDQNIWKVVQLETPAFTVPDEPGADTPLPIYSGNSTSSKIAAIRHAAVGATWYRDPFETPAPSTSETASASTAPAAPLSASPSSSAVRTTHAETARFQPYSRKGPAPGKSQRGSTSAGRNKFVHLSVEGMPPPAIIEWADALSQVDQSIKPLTDNAADRSYILPEPALFVNTTPERRRQLLHHWNLVGDGFYYMLGQPEHVQLLSAQQWRDVLEGRMAKRGAEGSRRNKRTGDLEELLRPALDAANVSSIEGFPVPIQNVPQFTLAQIEANVWRVAETSFRFELAALDRRAANTQRLAAVKACFAGGLLLGFPLEMAVLGWAAPTVEQRHPFVANTARLMLSWRCTSPVPDIVRLHWHIPGLVAGTNASARTSRLPILHAGFLGVFWPGGGDSLAFDD